jgi:hypothetical protein
MRHFAIIIGLAVTCVLTAVANVIVARMTGLNVFTMKVWVILPVGAALVGAAAASGGILAARLFHAAPTKIDAAMMVLCAAFTMWLIYYLDYMTMVLDDGRKVSNFISFQDYVDLVITKAHMRIGRAQTDTGEVGQFGYWLAVVEFIGFLVGGFSAFAIVKDMPRCSTCGAYFRKLKLKNSGVVTPIEAEKLLEFFREGHAGAVTQVLNWKPPPERQFGKGEKAATLTYELLGCPKCKTEKIVAKVRVFNGKQWIDVPSSTTSRDLSGGLSLRAAFQ